MIRQNYNHTIYAAYIGYITQAIIVNFSPLLFLTFQRDYQISLGRISFLVSFNFVIQLLVDMIAARYVDRIGYRPCILAAHVSSVIGLVGLALFPSILPPYAGLLLATAFCAVGGGLIEVLISPIVEACPTEKKEAAMSILHSFYSWGQVFVVLLSTVFFTLFGTQNWKIMAVIWALVPFCNIFYFSQVPIATLLLMACAGASEQSMAQWASAFAEAGLQVSKTVGDLAGPCAFAVAMGITRALYGKFSEKVPLSRFMTISGILCVISYLLASLSPNPVLALVGCSLCGFSVGIMWPGTLSLASKRIPLGGTAMFALLALAGDLGCATGPALVGNISDAFQSNLKIGILFAICSPILLLLGLFLLRAFRRKAAEK